MHNPTETENRRKNEGREEVQSDLLHDLPDWLQEFSENLVDKSSPLEPRTNHAPKDRDTSSSSHEVPMESRAKVGKHSIEKKQGLLVQSCPKRKFFGDLITTDHTVLSEESESRNNHRYAVVVQDLATQWLQSYPCKTKTSQETQKSEVLGAK